MKNKTKVVLLSAAISVSALGVFGATTFAWFTEKSKTEMTFQTATIKSNSTNLDVRVYSLEKELTKSVDSSTSNSNADGVYNANWSMIDLSSGFGDKYVTKKSDGSFAWASEDVVNDSVVTFGLGITTQEVLYESVLKLKLDWSCNESNADKKEQIESWVRGSMIEYEDSAFTTPTSNKITWLGDVRMAAMFYYDYDEENQVFDKVAYADYTTTEKGMNYYASRYTTPTTRYYKISFWFEGSLADNQDIARSKQMSFSVNVSSATA